MNQYYPIEDKVVAAMENGENGEIDRIGASEAEAMARVRATSKIHGVECKNQDRRLCLLRPGPGCWERVRTGNDSIHVPSNSAPGGNSILPFTERSSLRRAPVQPAESIPGWRAQIDEIDPATIVVPYHIGKLIEDNKKILLQNLELVSLYSTGNLVVRRD